MSFPWILAAGAFAAAAGYTASTYLVFLACFTLLLAVFRASLAPRALAIGAVAAITASPLIRQAYVDRSSFTYERYPGADRYVADFFGYVTPSPRQSFLGTVAGHAFDRNVTETTVFAGYLLAASALAAVVLRRAIPRASFWIASAVVFFVLSLGSTLRVGGIDTGVPLPFSLLTAIPLLDELRAPSRFSIVAVLSLAVLLALVWSRAMNRFGRPLPLTFLASALLAFEYLALPTPLFPAGVPPLYRELAKEAEATVVEIPGIEQAPLETMYHQTFHQKPIFIGTAARVPREKSDYYLGLPLVRPLIDLRKGKVEPSSELDELIRSDREAAPRVARFLGLGYFIIDRGYEKRGVVSYLEALLPVDRWYENESVIVLSTRRSELPPDPDVLEAGALESRQHFESGFRNPGARRECLGPLGKRRALDDPVSAPPGRAARDRRGSSPRGVGNRARRLARWTRARRANARAGMAGGSVPPFDAGRRVAASSGSHSAGRRLRTGFPRESGRCGWSELSC